MSEESRLTGPDFSHGVPLTDVADGGMLLGHAAGEPVLLARTGREAFAVGAECTHYHGPLAEGLRIADTVRCPWHLACFNLRTGEALHAPALDPVACWPYPLTGEAVRIEHWVVAERQGQTAARNILGSRAAPFFWTQQHDLTLSYVGHARQWDRVEIDGSIGDRDATVSHWQGGQKLAALTIGRDLDSLGAELELERIIAAGG